MNQVYLILGSNIDPELNIPEALKKLVDNASLCIKKASSVWKTRPVGDHTENYFLNLAIYLETDLEIENLKRLLRLMEDQMGRVRLEDKFAPRTIDLDIVIFNKEILENTLFKHDYMILPFAEIIPDLVSPEQGLSLKVLATTIQPFSTARKVNLELPQLL